MIFLRKSITGACMFNIKGKTILVTGATGHQGGAVADSLLRAGWNVRAFTRGRNKKALQDLKRAGAQIALGDLNDRDSLGRALNGIYGVFAVTAYKDIGTDGEISHGKNIVDSSISAGVKHLIFSSAAASNRKTGIPYFESKWVIEQYIKESGVPATVFRPVFYMYNFDYPDTEKYILEGALKLGLKPDKPLQMLAPEVSWRFCEICL